MNSEQKQASVNEMEMTPNNVLADGWRLTRAILALKDMEIPDTIEFQIDGANHIRATRVATLEELAKAVAALNEAIEHRSGDKPNVTTLHGHLEVEELNKQRDALVELHKRVGQRAEREHWLAIRKKEALRIDPETAEVTWWYAQVLDPYGVLDEWELRELDCIGRAYFARAPGSDIWVEFGDLPDETRKILQNRRGRGLDCWQGLRISLFEEASDSEFPNDFTKDQTGNRTGGTRQCRRADEDRQASNRGYQATLMGVRSGRK